MLTDDDVAIQTLIAQLDAESYLQREQASAALKDLGKSAEPALRDALTLKSLPEETRVRIEAILPSGRLQTWQTSAQRRDRRIVEALELINSNESRAIIVQMANDATGFTAFEAKAAARRLSGTAPIPSKLELPPDLFYPHRNSGA